MDDQEGASYCVPPMLMPASAAALAKSTWGFSFRFLKQIARKASLSVFGGIAQSCSSQDNLDLNAHYDLLCRFG